MYRLCMVYRTKKKRRFNMVMSEADRKALELLCEKLDQDASVVIRKLIHEAAKAA